jgi:hypothetical protein
MHAAGIELFVFGGVGGKNKHRQQAHHCQEKAGGTKKE